MLREDEKRCLCSHAGWEAFQRGGIFQALFRYWTIVEETSCLAFIHEDEYELAILVHLWFRQKWRACVQLLYPVSK